MLQGMVAYAVDNRYRKLKSFLYFVRAVGRDETVGSYQLAVRRIRIGFLGLQMSQITDFKWVV